MLTVITFSCSSINAIAETASEIISTSGDMGCGNWILDKEQNRGKGWYSTANESWLRGFLSGFALNSRINVLKDMDDSSLILWMNNYCRANPLASISDAGVSLFYVLRTKKGLN